MHRLFHMLFGVSALSCAPLFATMNSSMQHPRFGTLNSVTTNNSEWTSSRLEIKALGYRTQFHFFTEGAPPTSHQLSNAVKWLDQSIEFKNQLSECIAQHYREYIRPAYLESLGNPRSKRQLKAEDLPEIAKPSEIWKMITRLNGIFIDEQGDSTFSFAVSFDREHELTVRIRNGIVYEVGMDG